MHYVFLFHGSSRNKVGWSKPFVNSLLKKAEKYTSKSASSLNAKTKFIEINYAQTLDKLIGQLIAGGEMLGPVNDWLKGAYTRRKAGLSIVDGHTESSIAGNLSLEFLMDGLAYLWNPETARFIHLEIASQVLPVIQASQPGDRFSFLGHGMGTKVLFDFLHKFYAGDGTPFQVQANGNPTVGSPTISYLYMIGNASLGLSKLDFNQFDPNSSYVRIVNRNTIPRQGGVVRLAYRVFSNELDWLARLGKNDQIHKKQISENVTLKSVSGLLLHQLDKYLDNPKVHIRLIEDLFMDRKQIPNRVQIMETYEQQINVKNIAVEIRNVFSKFGENQSLHGKIEFFDFLKETAQLITKIS